MRQESRFLDPSKPPEFVVRLFQGSRKAMLVRAAAIIAVVAVIDWRFDVNISFGFLYLFPMLMVGAYLGPLQIAGVAALCTGLSEVFGPPYGWTIALGVPRLIVTFAAFYGAGIYVFQSARNRRLAAQHLEQIEREAALRREADEQLRFLIESSPAAILTLGADRSVLVANEAAHRLLELDSGELEGRPIATYLPALARVPISGEAPLFRTTMECRGRRQDGGVFLAQVWFSTYQTRSGPRLAAVVLDASDELRDRQEYSLQQLLAGSKIVVGAMFHEIRNICGAIGVVHTKLARDERLSENADLRALGNLVEGLGRMAGLELAPTKRPLAEVLEIRSVLEELRIVIEPEFRESGISIRWDVPDSIPPVWAERQALLQAFLNLVKNSQRAMEQQTPKQLTVAASLERESVVVRFIDTGCGVAAPEELFKPFQRGAVATGLGLYLSRAFLRGFHGEIVYEAQPTGCCFAVLLPRAAEREEGTPKEDADENSTIAAGRPHPVSGESRQAAGH
jgi:PAS domain S-box-containing protein